MPLIAPSTGVMGEGELTGTPLSATAPTMVRLAWVKLLPFTVLQLQTDKMLNLSKGET